MKPTRILTAVFFSLLPLLANCAPGDGKKTKIPPAKQGVFILPADWKGTASLEGEWEFYWKKLYGPEVFSGKNPPPTAEFIRTPGAWNDSPRNGKKLNGYGYATYRLRVHYPPGLARGTRLGLKIPTIHTAARIYIDGRQAARFGKVGRTAKETRAQFRTQTAYFPAQKDGAEIVLLISNFDHRRGGLWNPPRLGLERDILKQEKDDLIFSFLVAGALLIISIYHFTLFAYRTRDTSALYFGLFCFFVLLRSMATGDYNLLRFFPQTNFLILIRLEYISSQAALAAYAGFIRALFPGVIHRLFPRILGAICLVLVLTTLILPPGTFSRLAIVVELMVLFGGLYALGAICVALARRREGSFLFLAGFLTLFLSGLNDILYARGILQFGYLLPVGLLLFILIQSALSASRFARAFSAEEQLTEELEERVALRTKELQEEKNRSEALLLNILPEKTAEELKRKDSVAPQDYNSAAILFTDIVKFTTFTEGMKTAQVLKYLDGYFSSFDDIIERHGLEKLKTIGDSYMCAGGLPLENKTHALDVCLAALEMQNHMQEIRRKNKDSDLPYWPIRIGIHVGPVSAGVIGKKKFTYDIWGDAVNTASRMESSGEAERINVSEDVYRRLKDYFQFEYRGKIKAKNKGPLKMYFLERIRPAYASDKDGRIPGPELEEARLRLSQGKKTVLPAPSAKKRVKKAGAKKKAVKKAASRKAPRKKSPPRKKIAGKKIARK